MNDENKDEQLIAFTGFAKKNFKKAPTEVLPSLWQLHYHMKDTFDEALSRIVLQFYLDTQTVMGDVYAKERKLVDSSKAQLEQLNEIRAQFEKTNFTHPTQQRSCSRSRENQHGETRSICHTITRIKH